MAKGYKTHKIMCLTVPKAQFIMEYICLGVIYDNCTEIIISDSKSFQEIIQTDYGIIRMLRDYGLLKYFSIFWEFNLHSTSTE